MEKTHQEIRTLKVKPYIHKLIRSIARDKKQNIEDTVEYMLILAAKIMKRFP